MTECKTTRCCWWLLHTRKLTPRAFDNCSSSQPRVHSGDQYSSKWSVQKLLTRSLREDHNLGNFWLGPHQKTGEFKLDFGEEILVSKISLVNTHNGNHRDRSTKKFRVELAESDLPRILVLQDTLQDSRQMMDPLPLLEYSITPRKARYVYFSLLSFYGYGGGLQYFGTDAC